SSPNETWEWDGSDWGKALPVKTPPVRQHAAMAYDVARGRTVLYGGCGDFWCGTGWMQDVWEWDGTNWGDKTPASGPPPRGMHALAYGGSGATVMFGGCIQNSGGPSPPCVPTGDAWSWNGTSWSPIVSSQPPGARGRHAMVYDTVNSKVLVIQGSQAPYN